MNILIIGFSVIAFTTIIVKIFNMIYISRMTKESQRKKVELENVNLISSTVSYEQFEKVARETSVLNSPVRTQGDFMDFVIDSISFTDCGIENKILTLNYGEEI